MVWVVEFGRRERGQKPSRGRHAERAGVSAHLYIFLASEIIHL